MKEERKERKETRKERGQVGKWFQSAGDKTEVT